MGVTFNPLQTHMPPFQKGVQRVDNKTTQCKESYIAVCGENSVTRSQRISETGGNTRRHNVIVYNSILSTQLVVQQSVSPTLRLACVYSV